MGLHGFELLDDDLNTIVKVGMWTNDDCTVREFLVEEGERILGIASRIEKRYSE